MSYEIKANMSYEIKANVAELAIRAGETKKVSFTVNNISNRSLLTLSQVHTNGSVESGWCSLEPEGDATIDAHGNRVYELTIAPQNVEGPTGGNVSLQTAWVEDPANVSARSLEIAVTLMPGSGPVPGWWKRNGLKVGGVALALFMIGAIWRVLMGGSHISIASFVSAPEELQAGDSMTFSWNIEGDPLTVFLELGGQEPLPIDKSDWQAGQMEFTPLEVGLLKARLIAVHESSGEGSAAIEVASTVEVLVTAPNIEFLPPKVTAFSILPGGIKAGDPVAFEWIVAGDIAGMGLEVDSNRHEIGEPGLWAEGRFESLQLAGSHKARLLVLGKDESPVASEEISFEVEESATIVQPKVTFSVIANKVDKAAKNLYRNVEVEWNVGEPHTKVELLAGGELLPLKASGRQSIGPQSRSTRITLLVTLSNNQAVRYDRLVGGIAVRDLRGYLNRIPKVSMIRMATPAAFEPVKPAKTTNKIVNRTFLRYFPK